MHRLTPWFNFKIHSPVREGWYDCKESNARHYFKDGFWYLNKKSLKVGPMVMSNLHWRGLARPSLESLLAECDSTIPRSQEEQAWLDAAPVGREFGSPDFERLMREDFEKEIRVSRQESIEGKIKPYKFG